MRKKSIMCQISCLLLILGLLSGCITHKYRADPAMFTNRIHTIPNLVVNGNVEFINTANKGFVEFYTLMGKSFQMDYHQVTQSTIDVTRQFLAKTEHKTTNKTTKRIFVRASNGDLRQIAGGWNHTMDITIQFKTDTGIVKTFTKSGTEWGVTNDAKLTEAIVKAIEQMLHDKQINAYLSK